VQQFDRPNSAYMLFYERADSLEPVAMLQEATAAPPQEGPPPSVSGTSVEVPSEPEASQVALRCTVFTAET